jgi:hypothetical protein
MTYRHFTLCGESERAADPPLSSKVSHRRIPSWSLIEEARTVVPGLLPLSLKERPDDGRETITSAYLPLGGDLSTDSEAPARGEPGLLVSLRSLDRPASGLGRGDAYPLSLKRAATPIVPSVTNGKPRIGEKGSIFPRPKGKRLAP